MFSQLTSVQRRLRAVKSHLFAWAVLYLNMASYSEKWAITSFKKKKFIFDFNLTDLQNNAFKIGRSTLQSQRQL